MTVPDTSQPVGSGTAKVHSRRLLPRWLPATFAVLAVAMVPWIVFVATTLPGRYRTANYDLAWAGFDVGLALALAATGWGLWRRSPFAYAAAVATGTLLVVDAWFDVVTAHRGTDRLWAMAAAAFAEIPLAIVCFAIAARIANAKFGIGRSGR